MDYYDDSLSDKVKGVMSGKIRISTLEPLNTVQLLRLLDETRRVPQYCYDLCEENALDALALYRRMLKAILMTREHIPSKKESKLIRQKLAKNRKNGKQQIRKR